MCFKGLVNHYRHKSFLTDIFIALGATIKRIGTVERSKLEWGRGYKGEESSFPAKLSVSADTLYTRKSLSRPCFVLPFLRSPLCPFARHLGRVCWLQFTLLQRYMHEAVRYVTQTGDVYGFDLCLTKKF